MFLKGKLPREKSSLYYVTYYNMLTPIIPSRNLYDELIQL